MAKSKPDKTSDAPNTADTSDDDQYEKRPDKSAIEIVNKLFNDHLDVSIQVHQRIWERNLLYSMGEQQLDWQLSTAMFQRRGKAKNKPTPTDNIIRDYLRSMKAMVLNKEYGIRVWPNSNDLKDREASELGGDVLRHMDTMNDDEFDVIKDWLAHQMILFGTSFCRTYPAMESGEWNMTKDGLIMTGDVGNEVILPFNLRFDDYGDMLKKKREVGIKSLKDREWVEDTFLTLLPSGDDDDKMDYQKRLMKLVSNVSGWKGAGIDSSLFDLGAENMVVFKEVEIRPTKRHPNGRYIIAVGDKILLEQEKMPIPVKKGKFYYTITDFHYHHVPGRFLSDAGVNDQISPQDEINDIDASLKMNRKGLGRPIVSMPKGGGIKRLNTHGQSFIALEFDSLLTGGAKPEVDRGLALPQQILEERQIKKSGAADSGGNPRNILSGKSPGSQSSGKLAGELREAAEQGHTPDVKGFYRSLKEVYTKRLVLAQLIYTEERMIKIAGEGHHVEIKNFKGADLRDNTDVRLELDASAVATKSGQTVQITEMAKSGVFNADSTVPPEIQEKLMQQVGIKTFETKTNIHIRRTERENARIATANKEDFEKIEEDGQVFGVYLPGLMATMDVPNPDDPNAPPEQIVISGDPAFKMESHQLCMETHLSFILSAEFGNLPEEAQIVAINHYDAHNFAMQSQMAEKRKMAMQDEQMKAEINQAKKPPVAGTG